MAPTRTSSTEQPFSPRAGAQVHGHVQLGDEAVLLDERDRALKRSEAGLEAGKSDDSSEDQTVGDSILKGERAAVVEDSSDEEGAHQKSPAKKEKGEAKKQKGKRAAVVVDSSDEEGAHRESPRDQQKGKRPAAVPVVDSSDERRAPT